MKDKVRPQTNVLATAKVQGRLVCAVIVCRLVVELLLTTILKRVYAELSNPGALLASCAVFNVGMCVILHLFQKRIPFMPSVFGGVQWRVPRWSAMAGLVVPSLCVSAMLIIKQWIIKKSGPGYAEMIASVGVPISALMQYYINGITIGPIAIVACIFSGMAYFLCFFVCAPIEMLGGAMSCLLNATRGTLTKKSNQKHKLTPGLNIIYTSFMSAPIYITMATLQEWYQPSIEEKHWSNIFKWYGPVPFYKGHILFHHTLVLLSNLLVFVILDIASPLTYTIAAGLKGILQTFFDIFYIDYKIAVVAATLGLNINPEQFKNTKELTFVGKASFGCKCTYFGLYAGEKVHTKLREDREAKALLDVLPISVELNGPTYGTQTASGSLS